jgi:hypothetical protein
MTDDSRTDRATDATGTPSDAEIPADGVTYETRVPPGESPVRCPYCDRPLESEKLLVLHEGLDHWTELSDEEREAFRETYQAETDDLRTFRLKMFGVLILAYFAFLFVYSYHTKDPFSATALVVASISARGR